MASRIGILFLAAIFLSSCNDGLVSTSPVKDLPLLLELEINGNDSKRWEDITAAFTITNISDETVSFGFPSSCQVGYTVKRNGRLIFDSRNNFGCLAVITSFKLKPGESRTFPIEFTYVGDGTIPEGHYRVSAFLLDGQSAKVSEIFQE